MSHESRLRLPQSPSAVSLAVIDSTTWLGNCTGELILEPCPPGAQRFEIPSYSFMIHHKSTNTRLLFDLGLRKNWKTHLSPHLLENLAPLKLEVSCEKDVADILLENDISLDSIDAIIFSHHHWDHVGDTTMFPSTTKIIVGPGYKAKFLPGWPKDPQAADTTSDLYENRETQEINFDRKDDRVTEIGGFSAYDWFRDGSFYLLDTPGHTTGHLSALARTTTSTAPDGKDDSTFVFLGGDVTHHCALFRPSKGCPLPVEISPSPFEKPSSALSCCLSDRFLKLHPLGDEDVDARTTPLARVPNSILEEDYMETQRSIDKLAIFDADPRVFTIFAHDETLLDVIDFFPKPLDDWRANGWGNVAHWRFLASLP